MLPHDKKPNEDKHLKTGKDKEKPVKKDNKESGEEEKERKVYSLFQRERKSCPHSLVDK
jgi:hypothetical protein